MASLAEARDQPERQLWDALGSVDAGMLGIVGASEHMQPMAHHVDEDGKRLWFYTSRSTDLVRSLEAGAQAHFCLVGKSHDYHACIAGRLSERLDRAIVDKYWSPVVAAWYDGGKDDPELTMLVLELDDAAIWASTRNPIAFGWQIAKANLKKGDPDVGVRARVDFAKA
jgi:general stress protein 26